MTARNHDPVTDVQVHVGFAAVFLIIATLASCGGASEESPEVVTAASSLETSASAAATATQTSGMALNEDQGIAQPTTAAPPSADEMGRATPERLRPGDRVVLTPGSTVERNCTDIVGVYDFDDLIVGQIVGGDQWEPVPSAGTSPTWPACLGDVTDASIEIIVPPLRDGGYRFCVSVVVDFVGCASVFIAAQ